MLVGNGCLCHIHTKAVDCSEILSCLRKRNIYDVHVDRLTYYRPRIAGAIIRLVAFVCVYIRLSVGTLLFEPFDL